MTFRPIAPGRLRAALALFLVAGSLAACSGSSPATASPSATPTVAPSATTTPTAATPTAVAPTASAPTPARTPAPTAAPSTPTPATGGATGGMLARGVYANSLFRVEFRYPPTWTVEAGYDQRWSGPDGFVQVLAFDGSGMTVQQAAELIASHHLQPYGSHPTIEPITVDGVEGRLILPSADQAPEMKNAASVIVAPPSPIVLDTGTYHYLQIDADVAHIRDIAASAQFITGQPGGTGAR